MTKVVLLNSPKGTGKTVTNRLLHEQLYREGFYVEDIQFKDKLFDLTASLFNLHIEEFMDCYNDRETKENPCVAFQINTQAFLDLAKYLEYSLTEIAERCPPECKDKVWLSTREAMIYVSQFICKPTFGEEYFGEAFAAEIGAQDFVIDDSCGFIEEINPVIEKVGADNVYVVQFTRDGIDTFEGDSRGWVNHPDVKTIRLTNDGELEDFVDDILAFLD